MPRRSNPPEEFNEQDAQALLDAFLRLSPRMRVVVLVVVAVVGLIAAFVWYENQRRRTTVPVPPVASVHMLLGNPSSATPDPANRDNYLMVKPYFDLSYNDDKGTPNWVSWQVTAADLGEAPRKQIFDSDSTLPPGFYQVTHKDYSGSGFDRGHMCPHSDRGANEQMSFATFVMTNIIPQAPNVNQKAWAQLEHYCRTLVRRGQDHLYVTSGPAGRGGRGSRGPAETIARGRVAVPSQCWKVIVVVPAAGDGGDGTGDAGADLNRIDTGTRVIAVVMPNDQDVVGEEWAGYRTSVAEIEGLTGLRFFDRLPPAVAQVLRQKIDDTPIPPPRPLGHVSG